MLDQVRWANTVYDLSPFNIHFRLTTDWISM